jgi:dTDP-4-amino-4,6-dideoxygalactose transaminase
MSNAHASLILDSLRRIDLTLENRWLQWHTYNELCPKEWRMPRPDAPWVFAMRIPGIFKYQQNTIVNRLRDEYSIEARHCFQPSCGQEEYRDCRMVAGDNINGTKSRLAAREVIYLPLSSYNTKCHLNAFDVIQRILG